MNQRNLINKNLSTLPNSKWWRAYWFGLSINGAVSKAAPNLTINLSDINSGKATDGDLSAAFYRFKRQLTKAAIGMFLGHEPKGGLRLCQLLNSLSLQRYKNLIKSPV